MLIPAALGSILAALLRGFRRSRGYGLRIVRLVLMIAIEGCAQSAHPFGK